MKAAEISARLTSRIVGQPVRVFYEATSTNDLAMQAGAEGAPEGAVIFAEKQLRGRGRLGRSWQSQPGESLTFSVLLRPAWPDVSRISLVAAAAVAGVLQTFTAQPVGIKWPNDIHLGGKKVAGILCEAGRGFVVVGIGLNVLQTAAAFPEALAERAGSLAMFADTPPDRASLAAALLNELDRLYLTLPGGFAEILAECERRSVLLEKTIAIEMGGSRLGGTVLGLDASGGLKIREPSGRESVVLAGEITLLTA